MRILFCGVAAVALSGCSWMGFGNSSNSGYAYNNDNSGCCFGEQALSRWNFEQSASAEFGVGGTAITGSQVSTAAPAPVMALTDVDMKDAYKTGLRLGLGGSYALNPNRKIVMEASYSKAKGQEVGFGTQGGTPIFGQMTAYKSYGINAGLRQYFKPQRVPLIRSIRPYIEGRVGAERVDDISLAAIVQTVPSSPSTPTILKMYEASWVPNASGMVGFETPLLNRLTLGVETGIRYSGKLKSDNTDVAAGFNTRYAGFNNGGERLTVPVTIRGRYRF